MEGTDVNPDSKNACNQKKYNFDRQGFMMGCIMISRTANL